MKPIYLLILIIFLSQKASLGQTQVEMNQNTIQELNQLKLKFDSIITQIEKEHKSDTSFISALYTANHKWLQFINAQIKMKFPKRPPGWYGSNHIMCIAIQIGIL